MPRPKKTKAKPPTRAESVTAGVSSIAAIAQDKCRAHHTGPWMVEPQWFANTIEMINKGHLLPKGETVDPDEGRANSTKYQVVEGVAVIPIKGAMMKARSKFGGTSTIDTRNAIRLAASDDNVESILIHIDSPGGTSAGTDSLAQDVAAANLKKPVHAHIEDMGASAAYWVASQARYITASRGSLVGSLGTRMSVVDSSAADAQDGLKVLSFATGEFKAAGVDGTVITERQQAYFQQIVDDCNQHFKDAVATGREMSQAEVDAAFDGKVHDADTAKEMKLIDDVCSVDAAVSALCNLADDDEDEDEESNSRQIGMTPEVASFLDASVKSAIGAMSPLTKEPVMATETKAPAVVQVATGPSVVTQEKPVETPVAAIPAGEPVAAVAAETKPDTATTEAAQPVVVESLKASDAPVQPTQTAFGAAEFLAAFGDVGARWFYEGKSFAACTSEFITGLKASHKAESDKLIAENESLKTKLGAIDRGNDPAAFTTEKTAPAGNAIGKKKGMLPQKVGTESMAAFVAGIAASPVLQDAGN